MRQRSAVIIPLAFLLLFPGTGVQAEPPAEPHRSVLVRTAPVYPELARRMRVAGQVSLRVNILADGTVSDIHIESGHALLRQAAEEAVRHWRFVPAPAPSECHVTVTFDSP